MKFIKAVWLTVLHFAVVYSSCGQVSSSDSVKFDYKKIYGFALDGNISPVFSLLEYDAAKKISDKDKAFKSNFEKRFRYAEDKSDFLADKGAIIDSLLIVFRDYWRVSVLDYSGNYDSLLKTGITSFLYAAYPELKGKPVFNEEGSSYIKKYLAGKGLFMTDDIGKTGRLFDLLVWKTQKDTLYTFKVHKETIPAKVVFMDDFITLGWEEYATLGKLYPAGWATKEALYCVRKAYDLSSERFLISYLAHEGRHFEDSMRYFNAAGAHPDGSIGEDHADEIHLIPLAIRAANGGPPLKVFGEDYPTPDGTCLRDYIHVCDLADAHLCALEALERAPPWARKTSGPARRTR